MTAEADLILYNTCSIRDKAEQKVTELADYKEGFRRKVRSSECWVCVAQQRAKDFRARAACVAGVRVCVVSEAAGDADAVGWAGSERFTGDPRPAGESARAFGMTYFQMKHGAKTGSHHWLDDRQTDECFETEFTARTNPHRGYP